LIPFLFVFVDKIKMGFFQGIKGKIRILKYMNN
jgi:hypothetical protein